jgi:Kef-type K+ transport system membrane component KefB
VAVNLLTLLVQILVILIASRAVGWSFRKIHQPQVVGEMAAGLILGPSVLGAVWPHAFTMIFPPGSLGYLNALSQVGLVLFMFLIGLELDPALLRGRGRTALVTSQAGIVVPFLLGVAYALYLYPRLSPPSVGLTGFALFLGAALSVTAFPVLARILTERKLIATPLGAVTIACAAVADVTAWCILAVVVVVVRSGAARHPLWLTLTGAALYVIIMLFGVRYGVRVFARVHQRRGRLTQDMVALVLVFALASAWVTEWLGIHALFGAFLAGAVMPKHEELVREMIRKLEDFTIVFLLPLFFAFTGLRTSLGLVHGAQMWLYCAGLITLAVLGKFGGSALAAKLTGMPGREAVALGILMNTRGLMELVILNIGLDIGVISQTVFAMMVLMALVTTFMTTPLLQLVYPIGRWYGTAESGARPSTQRAGA